MRIIAGTFKSRRLVFPKTKTTRPTMDRVRESLFSSIGSAITNAIVLDLYAGCGSIGLEALSRGASKVYFVEKNRHALNALRSNIDALSVNTSTVVYSISVDQALAKIGLNKTRFDYVFMDPPYHGAELKKTLMNVYHFGILQPSNGRLIIEHSSKDIIELPEHIQILDVKKFGSTFITILEAGT